MSKLGRYLGSNSTFKMTFQKFHLILLIHLLMLFFTLIVAKNESDTNTDVFYTGLFAALSTNQKEKAMKDLTEGRASNVTCKGCQFLLEFGRKFLKSEKVVTDLFHTVCILLQTQSSSVCRGLSTRLGPSLFHIVTKSKLSNNEMCATLIAPECMTESEYLSSKSYWEIRIPPRQNKYEDDGEDEFEEENNSSKTTNGLDLDDEEEDEDRDSTEAGKGTATASDGRILHLSDIHIDPNYVTGSATDCPEPLCCSLKSRRTKNSTNAGHWASYGKCDLPPRTVQATFAHIKSKVINENFLYVAFTGDMAPHNIWTASKESVRRETRMLTGLFKKFFSSGPQLVPVVGNHEAYPVNMFPPLNQSGPFSQRWLYEELYQQWSNWIPTESNESFKRGGFYSITISRRLKLVVINSNYCLRLNVWHLLQPIDLGGQLKWLTQQLESAEKSNQFVHILGHIPPDRLQCTSVWLFNYLRIITRFQAIIKAQFFGHTHLDEIRLFHSTDREVRNPISVAYIGGSLTTYENVNPMFRIYHLANQASIEDHETHYLNITSVNKAGSHKPLTWLKEYTARSAYSMGSLSVKEWTKVFKRMQTNGKLFHKYYNHYHRFSGAKSWSGKCSVDCQKKVLDSIKVVHSSYSRKK